MPNELDPRPIPPHEPALEECCQKGCEPCVFDRYNDALERYHERLEAWLRRHPEADAPPAPGPGPGSDG